jgi:hypothetical protein
MSDALIPFDAGMLAIIKGLAGGGALAPFVREIMLLDCHVAGTSHVQLQQVEPALLVGDVLVMRREPDNPHDSLAILIFDERGNKLGYIPRAKNEVLARLMDAGKLLFARIESKEWLGEWLKISARVFMRDI